MDPSRGGDVGAGEHADSHNRGAKSAGRCGHPRTSRGQRPRRIEAVETLVLIVIALAVGLLAGATLYVPRRRAATGAWPEPRSGLSTMAPWPSASALRPAPPGSSTSEAFAPRSSTGSSPATRAGSSSSASRTRTRAARSRSPSSRSSGRSRGSGSTGTATSPSSSTRFRATRVGAPAAFGRARVRGRRRDSLPHAQTRGRPRGRTRSGADRIPEREARGPRPPALGRPAHLQPRGRARRHDSGSRT